MSNRIFWITSPQEEQSITRPKAHLAYRISNGHLLRGPLPVNTYGGIMAIFQFEQTKVDSTLVSELTEECACFGYREVFIATTDKFDKNSAELFEILGSQLSAYGITLIVPHSYASFCKHVAFSVSTSISGGSLRDYLESIIQTLGSSHLYLEHPLTQTEFTMPALTGNGTQISRNDINRILSFPETQVYYSPELFLNYCTYRQNGVPHFLLFDDERTIQAKIEFGKTLGIAGQLLLYHELADYYSFFDKYR